LALDVSTLGVVASEFGRRRRQPEIEAVILDVGGVLMTPDPEVIRVAVGDRGVFPDDAACGAAVFAATRAMDAQAVPAEAMDWDRVNIAFAEALGVHDPDDRVIGAIAAAFREAPYIPLPGAAAVLRELRDRGYRLGIVSNAHGTLEAQLADHGICSTDGERGTQVEVVVDSAVVGVHKPDAAIFQIALDAITVTAERALYVGDSLYFDVGGAVAAGLHVVHVNPQESCAVSGHDDVRGIADVPAYLNPDRMRR
jgi:putative hydrolase of the HAD superfamily